MQQCVDFQIGTSATTMRDITWYGIPYPTESPYQPYSVVRKCGDGTEKGYGFPACTWEWETLSQAQLDNLLSFFAHNTDASVDVYIRTYKDTGNERATGDFQVKMFRPMDGSGKTLQGGTRFWYRGVTVRFSHMIEV
jgi:hypothetical protein